MRSALVTLTAVATVLGGGVAAPSPVGAAYADPVRSAAVSIARPGLAPPVVNRVKPHAGPAAGGTRVVIKGHGLTKASKVLFGATRGRHLRVKGDRRLVVIAPPHRAKRVAVRVVGPGGRSKVTRQTHFTYRPARITAVAPKSGPTVGGTLVTLSGRRLGGTTSVLFGSTPAASVTVVSQAQVRVIAPAHVDGVVDVRVVTPQGKSRATPADTFTYLPGSSLQSAVALPANADTRQPSRLDAVECPSPASCIAVGTYTTTDGQQALMAATITGVTTTTVQLPLPSSAPVSFAELADLSCASASFCVAVGRFFDNSPEEPLAETWNGSTWTADNLGGGQGFARNSVRAVSCVGPDFCEALGLGNLMTEPKLIRSFRQSGGAWATDHLVGAGTPTDVACTGVDVCVATSASDDGTAALWRKTSSDSTWTGLAAPLPADADGTASSLRSIACSSSTRCVATGSYTTSASGTQGLIETYDGATWTPSTVPGRDSSTSVVDGRADGSAPAVHCTGPDGTCYATFTSASGGGQLVRIAPTDTQVRALPASPGSSSFLRLTPACDPASACTVVGSADVAGAEAAVATGGSGALDYPVGVVASRLTDVASSGDPQVRGVAVGTVSDAGPGRPLVLVGLPTS